jgi:replicative DNA helicase
MKIGEVAQPWSMEHEQGCIGSVLRDAVAFSVLKNDVGLCGEAFYLPGHRIVWEVMERLAMEGRPIDMLTIADQMKRDDTLDKVGGVLFLDGIEERTPTATQCEFYGAQVKGYWSRRKAIEAGMKVMQVALDAHEEDGLGAAAKGMEILAGVLDDRKRSTTNDEYMQRAFEKWEVQAGYRDRDETPPLLGLSTGLDRLDDLMNGLKKGVIVMPARQSTGKTALEGQICTSLAHEGVPVLRITRDSDIQELWDRDICRQAGVSMAKMDRGWMYGKQRQQVKDSIELMKAWPVRCVDDVWMVKDVCSLIRADHAKRGTKLVTIDYLQLLRTGNPRIDENANGRMDECMARIKGTAFALGIPIMVLSQVARDKDRLTGKTGVNWLDNRLIMEDVKDCGSVEQMAHAMLLLSKVDDIPDEETGHIGKVTCVAVDLAKHKGGPTGPIFMRFDRPYFRFEEYSALEQEAIMKFLRDERRVKGPLRVKKEKLDEPVFESVADAVRRCNEMPVKRGH